MCEIAQKCAFSHILRMGIMIIFAAENGNTMYERNIFTTLRYIKSYEKEISK